MRRKVVSHEIKQRASQHPSHPITKYYLCTLECGHTAVRNVSACHGSVPKKFDCDHCQIEAERAAGMRA